MVFYQRGSENEELSSNDLRTALHEALDKLGKRQKVLAIPPDYTRLHSKAGEITAHAWEYYGDKLTDILPALGTHVAMTPEEISDMFPKVPHDLRSEEHTSELQSRPHLVCRLLLEKKKQNIQSSNHMKIEHK